jgi:signal transduction histidine kinase
MRQLIDDLLSYARVASRGKSRAPTSLSEVLDNALESLQATIADRGAEIVRPALDDPLDGDLILHADARQLEQLYQNLISNALKFNQGAPRVVLSAERVAQRWVLGVHDNGIGMKPEYVGKVFEIFKRLHTREEYEGTGIGLAICRKIVERHGGEIWLESVPGRGSSFLFTIGDEVRDDKQDRTRA